MIHCKRVFEAARAASKQLVGFQGVDQEDACQDALLSLLEGGRLDESREAGDCEAYIRRVVFCRALDAWRKRVGRGGVRVAFVRLTRGGAQTRTHHQGIAAFAHLTRGKDDAADHGSTLRGERDLSYEETPEQVVWAAQLERLLGTILEKTEERLSDLQRAVFRACIYDEPLPQRLAEMNKAAFSWHAAAVRKALRETAEACGVDLQVAAHGIFSRRNCRVDVGARALEGCHD